jgi:hypothetical protein
MHKTFQASVYCVLHLQIMHVKPNKKTRWVVLHRMQVEHTSTKLLNSLQFYRRSIHEKRSQTYEAVCNLCGTWSQKTVTNLRWGNQTKEKLAAAEQSSTEGPFIGSWNWKHLLLFWGRSTAVSSFGYTRVILYLSFYFALLNVALCLSVLNVPYLEPDKSWVVTCSRQWYHGTKIVKRIAAWWHKKHTLIYTQLI